MMRPRNRNRVVWAAVVAILAAIWYFATRVRMQFVDPLLFLIILAAAAAALSMLLWWEIASDRDEPGDASLPRDPHPQPRTEGESP